MVFLLLVTLLTVCLHQFSMVPLASSFCSLHLHCFLSLQKSLGVFAMFITLAQTLISLIYVLPSFFLLVILGLKKDIATIVLFLDATSQVLLLPSLSPYPISRTHIRVLSVILYHYLLLTLFHSFSPNFTQPSLVPSQVHLQVYSCYLPPTAPMPPPTVSPSSDNELPNISDSPSITLCKDSSIVFQSSYRCQRDYGSCQVSLPKHVILVHGEKPKMATLKGRIYSELGIRCDDPANNETVCIPSTHHVEVGASNTFIRSSLNPNFNFSKMSSEDESDSRLKDGKFMPWLQVKDERAAEGILVEEKGKRAKIVHLDEFLLMLGEKKHDIRFAYCFPINTDNLEDTKSTDVSSSSNALSVSGRSSWLPMLYIKLSDELSGGNIQYFGEQIQVESFSVSLCLKDRCPYRIVDSPPNKCEAVFFCCAWSIADEKLAWKIISILENRNYGTL
ncbi:hypothetical protein I3842_06G051600 [Carya illinoinensis]|uniref:Uncharacterized protein n=1 Tax=Carya illinoinensis TaxID=32201 RepID=A0A922JHF9_CARIL|nr:hypothetical protein I3842_06G051600 [Carya illinoinensis]